MHLRHFLFANPAVVVVVVHLRSVFPFSCVARQEEFTRSVLEMHKGASLQPLFHPAAHDDRLPPNG
jgi:hypothetical protein